MNNAANICFKSACGRYGVSFKWSMFRRMLHECVKAGNKETGGIVWGKYNDKLDAAIVSGFSKAPIDSKAGWCSEQLARAAAMCPGPSSCNIRQKMGRGSMPTSWRKTR